MLYLIGHGGEFEDSDIFVKKGNGRIEVDYHFHHTSTLEVGLKETCQLVDTVRNLHLVVSFEKNGEIIKIKSHDLVIFCFFIDNRLFYFLYLFFWFCIIVSMHLDNESSDVLIVDASFAVLPTAFVLEVRSMPARSQKLSLTNHKSCKVSRNRKQ